MKPNNCPIPTITAVYGKEDRDFLIKEGNYPKENIVITGNQRYDFLPERIKEYDKKEIISELGLDDGKRTVLFITSPFSSDNNIKTLMNEIFNEISSLDNIQLIIKVHPTENERLYEESAKRFKNLDFKVIKNKNMFELLYVSDIAITTYSTAGLEAMIMKKPLIVINLTGEDYPIDYSGDGAALRVEEKGILRTAITHLLEHYKLKINLLKNADRYLHKHLYKVDGKAAERIINIIENEVKEW